MQKGTFYDPKDALLQCVERQSVADDIPNALQKAF